MTYIEFRDAVRETLEQMDTEELISIWNEIADGDDYIYSNDEEELDAAFSGRDPSYIIARIYFGDYRYNDNYFCFNAYGNLVSFDYWDDQNSPIDITAIHEHVVDDRDAFYNEDLQELIDEYDESADEDEDEEELL